MGRGPVPASNWARLLAAIISIVIVGDCVLFLDRFAHIDYRDYSNYLFIGAPCLLGFFCSLIVGWKVERPARDGVYASLYATGLSLVALLLVAAEGGICLLMASPLIFGFAMAGAMIGYGLQTVRWSWKYRHGLFVSVLLVAPFAMQAEHSGPPIINQHVVTTSILVHASPKQIWPLLCNLQKLPDPDFWLFRAGVAYPVGTRLEGKTRFCELSTGEMPERVVAWDPGRRLAFEVIDTPPSMKELNPFGDAHPAHLKGYFECERASSDWRSCPAAGRG